MPLRGSAFSRNAGPLSSGCEPLADVYCSHVLEHLPRGDLPATLRNTARMLRPGGVFRLVVPDLEWRARRYVAAIERGAADADCLFQSCRLGTERAERSFSAMIRDRFSRNAHCWMYDFAAMAALLQGAGFTAVRRCSLADSRDPMFAAVEQQDRFFDSGEPGLAIDAARA